MKKKIILSIITMISLLSICIYSFAMDNVTNNIRGFVGGAENIVENMVNDVSGGVKSGLNTVESGTENVVNDVRDGSQDAENTAIGVVTDNNNGNGYTASMTSTDQNGIANMSNNMWTWIIVGIIALAIGLMVWAYVRNKNNNDMYIDPDDQE